MSTAVEPTREGVEVRDLTSRRVRLDSLVEDPQNARLHDDRNLAGIAHSLQNFGQREPLVVRDGVVIGGNGRLRAMRELGWVECWVTDHSDLTEAQARALGVTLNRTAEIGTSWHAENLKLAIEACELECPEIVLDFKPVELAAIMPRPEVTEDEAPEPQAEVFAQRGDIICLGKHRVMCGDSTSAEDVGALLCGEKPDMVQTDPPYGVGYTGSKSSMFYGGGASGKPRAPLQGDETIEGAESLMAASLGIVTAPILFLWCAPQYFDTAKRCAVACGYKMFSAIVWNKSAANYAAMGATYKPKYEMVLACNRDGIPFYGPANEETVWDCAKANANRLHPTQKPIEIFARAISNHSQDGEIIYDPFLGSGTTLIAADQLGRRCFGMELEPRYVDVIVRRWLAHCAKTGRAPDVHGWRGLE